MKVGILIVAAMIGGTCSVGGERAIPPSEAEMRATQEARSAPAAPPAGDRWAGLPDECRELAEPCSACDEVERMRRKIEMKKCVPVCDAYVDRNEVLAHLPQSGIDLLHEKGVCGKEGTTCSAVANSACSQVIDYVTVGDDFRLYWENFGKADPGDAEHRFRNDFLEPYLDHHMALIEWAAANEVNAAPLLAAGGRMVSITSSTAIDEARRTMAERAEALDGLLELVLVPGAPESFAERRTAATP